MQCDTLEITAKTLTSLLSSYMRIKVITYYVKYEEITTDLSKNLNVSFKFYKLYIRGLNTTCTIVVLRAFH